MTSGEVDEEEEEVGGEKGGLEARVRFGEVLGRVRRLRIRCVRV